MSNINHNFGQPNPWSPHHVSDRADQLISELDEAQVKQLYDALKSKTAGEFLFSLVEQRAEISKYDWLKPAERKRCLQKTKQTDALFLHHACVVIELWRAKLHHDFLPLPPNGPPLNDKESQRELLLAALASYNEIEDSVLWPFDLPEGEEQLPFRRS